MQVHLRVMQEDDIAELINVMNQDAIAEKVNFPTPYTQQDAVKLMSDVNGNAERDLLVIECNGEYAGNINAGHARKGQPIIQFGYWVSPSFQGKGIASNAVEQFTRKKIEEGIVRMQALVEPYNTSSARVLEKCGYEREGLLRSYYIKKGKAVDVYMFSKVKD